MLGNLDGLGRIGIACASLALLASGVLTSTLLALGEGFETPIRVTILVLTFSLMTLCIVRFLGLFDTQGEDAGATAGNAFLEGKGLTERESQVAMLLACGLSSNEIASSLYLSASTIRVHASRVYAKCVIRSLALGSLISTGMLAYDSYARTWSWKGAAKTTKKRPARRQGGGNHRKSSVEEVRRVFMSKGGAVGVALDFGLLKLDEAQNREPYKVELTNAIEEERAAWLSAVQGA